jgi:hypothetical protein
MILQREKTKRKRFLNGIGSHSYENQQAPVSSAGWRTRKAGG